MKYSMQPRETEYKGNSFRSRLEARWALFFDLVGIRYRYEVGGFTLKNGMLYKPDFWLPDYEIWVEIKPDKPKPKEKLKARLLAEESRSPVYIFAGNVGAYVIYDAYQSRRLMLHECEFCGALLFVAPEQPVTHYRDAHQREVFADADWRPTEKLMRAYVEARSTRFEHFESLS